MEKEYPEIRHRPFSMVCVCVCVFCTIILRTQPATLGRDAPAALRPPWRPPVPVRTPDPPAFPARLSPAPSSLEQSPASRQPRAPVLPVVTVPICLCSIASPLPFPSSPPPRLPDAPWSAPLALPPPPPPLFPLLFFSLRVNPFPSSSFLSG